VIGDQHIGAFDTLQLVAQDLSLKDHGGYDGANRLGKYIKSPAVDPMRWVPLVMLIA
jgi:hypothetical protein